MKNLLWLSRCFEPLRVVVFASRQLTFGVENLYASIGTYHSALQSIHSKTHGNAPIFKENVLDLLQTHYIVHFECTQDQKLTFGVKILYAPKFLHFKFLLEISKFFNVFKV